MQRQAFGIASLRVERCRSVPFQVYTKGTCNLKEVHFSARYLSNSRTQPYRSDAILAQAFAVHSTPLHYLLYVDHNRQLQLKHHLHNLHSIVSIRKKLKLQA